MTIHEVLRQHEDRLLSLPNVTGVGIGIRGDRTVIKVLVTHKVRASDLRPDERVPGILDGFETDVDEGGIFQAEDDEAPPTT